MVAGIVILCLLGYAALGIGVTRVLAQFSEGYREEAIERQDLLLVSVTVLFWPVAVIMFIVALAGHLAIKLVSWRL